MDFFDLSSVDEETDNPESDVNEVLYFSITVTKNTLSTLLWH